MADIKTGISLKDSVSSVFSNILEAGERVRSMYDSFTGDPFEGVTQGASHLSEELNNIQPPDLEFDTSGIDGVDQTVKEIAGSLLELSNSLSSLQVDPNISPEVGQMSTKIDEAAKEAAALASQLNKVAGPNLGSVNRDLNNMANSTSKVNKESSNLENNFDFESTLLSILGHLDGMHSSLQQINQDTEDVNNKAPGVNNHFVGWKTSLLEVNAAISLIQTGINAIKKASDFVFGFVNDANEAYKYESQLSVVMSNQGNSLEEYQQILDIANDLESRTTYTGTALTAAASELSTYVSDTEALGSILDTFTDYAAGMSGMNITAKEAVDLATQLGKAFDGSYDGLRKKGFVLDDAQKQIIEYGSDLEKAQVISEIIGQSWEGLSDAFSNTPEGRMQRINNQLAKMSETIGRKMYGAVDNLLGSLETRLPDVTSMADSLATILSIGLNFIADVVIPGVSSALNFLRDNIETVKTATIILGAIGIAVALAMAVAWAVANWPILLVGLAVIGLANLLVSMGYTAEDVIGFVGGLFGGLFGFIYNLLADLWNLVAVVAEFFGNVWDDPIGSVVRLFAGLAQFVLGVLETIAGAIDAIFGTNLASTLANWSDKLGAMVEEKFGAPEFQIDRMEKIDIGEQAEKWSSGAKDILKAFDDMEFPNIFDPSAGIDFDEIDYIGEVGKIKGDVSLADEDLRLLKEYATLEYVNRYTTSRPTTNIKFGDVRETADVGQIKGAVESMIVDAWNSSLP